MNRLDAEERDLLESFEAGEWESLPGREAEINRYRDIAHATFRKEMRVNIRLSRKDLEALQTRALEEGIPYQTLMASILHKYISGRIVENSRSTRT